MAKFANLDNISSIKMDGVQVKCFCPIGKSMCTYDVTIEMEPDKLIPDYIEVGNMIQALNEREFTLESVCAEICDNLNDYVNPKKVSVTIRCEDAKHMPAEVKKTINNKKKRR